MAQRLENLAIGATLRIEAWDEATSRLRRVDVRSSYVERFWLPILGPSTTWLLRHFAQVLDDSPSGATVDLAEVARALGLGERSGRNGPLLRTIARAIDFGTAVPRGADRLGVRRVLPLLSGRQVARLPLGLRVEHVRAASEAPLDPVRRRGRRLALSLLELGEGVADTERQLGNWHFHPAVAAECAAWANAERNRVEASSGEIRPISTARRQLPMVLSSDARPVRTNGATTTDAAASSPSDNR